MRSDVAHAALSVDMYLQASADQSELTNLHNPAKTTPADPCPAGGDGAASDKDSSTGPGSGPGASNGPGCSTTGSQDNRGTTLAILLGLVTFGSAARLRRKRDARPRG
jgi:hypothetical protein